MNYELLNNIIEYIEQNLTEKINYKKIAKKFGLNDFIMQRVFSIITGISIFEYVRKRRLSLAYEELKLTDKKIIDIALKYGYDSCVSFTRSFKKEFDVPPSYVRKNKNGEYKLFPKLKFGSDFIDKNIINYVIKKIDDFIIYGKKVSAKTFDDLHYKIRKLYNNIKNNELYDVFNQNERYALTYYDNDLIVYLVGSKLKNDKLDSYKVKKGEYAIFEVVTNKQKDIIKTIKFIDEIWYESSKLEIKDDPYIECYTKNNCYIYVLLERRNKTDM